MNGQATGSRSTVSPLGQSLFQTWSTVNVKLTDSYVATEMTTSHTDERSKAYARKWQDMTPFDR